MNGKLKIKNLRQLYFYFAMLVTMFVTSACMFLEDNQAEIGVGKKHIYTFIGWMVWILPSFWTCIDCCFRHNNGCKQYVAGRTSIRWFFAYALTTCLMRLINVRTNLAGVIVDLSLALYPLCVLLGAYGYAKLVGHKKHIDVLVLLLLVVCAFSFLKLYSLINVGSVQGHYGVISYIIYLLPVVLINKHKWVRFLGSGVILFLVVASIKRQAFLSFSFALIAYFFVNQYIKGGIKLKTIFVSIISILVVCVLLLFTVSYLDVDIFERFANIGDDGGSGRVEIWSSIFDHLYKQDIFSWLVGSGTNYTAVISGYTPAHNDFLETIVDYGLFSLLLYIGFFLSLLHAAVKMTKQRSKYAPAMWAQYAIFVVYAMTSVMTVWQTYNIMMLNFGLLIGLNAHEKCNFLDE